ncbi:MAG TPA: hypothetical protein VMR14_17235 [Streptosporangiaceae bacterium]|nr:hypothetical protein [Streptosporangiaceae bacterium]
MEQLGEAWLALVACAAGVRRIVLAWAEAGAMPPARNAVASSAAAAAL